MLALPDLAKSLQRVNTKKRGKRTRAQNESAWSINRLFARREDDQELRDVSIEPDAGKKGHQKDAQQDKLGSLRDSGNLRNHRLISPRGRNDAELDGTSTSAWDVRSSCYSERMRRQAEEEDPSRDCTVHLQYVPFWALLGLAIMIAGCAVFSGAFLTAMNALKQLVTLVGESQSGFYGNALKQLVLMVGGSQSGFNGVIAAYVTTFTVTIAVSAICLGLAFAMYGMRTDQKLRRDMRYGASERSLGVYKVYYWLTTLLFLLMFVMAAWFVCLVAVNTSATMSMNTLINGADAGVAIISSAVAAANATLIRAHQVVGQIDTMASEWAQSPVGSIIGQLNGGNNVLNPYVNSNVNASSVAQQLVSGATAAGQLASGNGGDQKEAASTLINTVQKVASQLTPATPVPTPGPTPQANFLNLPNINLQNILSALPGANNGGNQQNAPAAPSSNPLAALTKNFQQVEQTSAAATAPVAPGPTASNGAAPAPQTLGTFAQQVLNDLVPNEESILKLAGMAGNGASMGTGRVKGEGSGADGWQFGSGHKDNSVCPSLACLDVKMYNFLNSEACVCTVEDLKTIRSYASDAQGHLKVALIGVVLLYLGAAILAVRLASESTTMYFERHLIWGGKFDRLHERKMMRLQQEEENELVAQRERELELQEAGKKKLQGQGTDIRVEVPGSHDMVAPRAPKSSPALTPGKASPKKPFDTSGSH